MSGRWVRMAVLFPSAIEESLQRAHAAGLVRARPTLFQLLLGILRMQWRVATRPDSVGTCTRHPVRSSWRARCLSPRFMRVPFLIAERAIAPLDFSGLASSRERVIRHLLGAHHDGAQFIYDMELLSMHEGALDELHERAKAVVEGRDPRAPWLRDLCVFEHYHEELLETLEAFMRGDTRLGPEVAADPDITLTAYLAWCASAPRTLSETWDALRRGALHFGPYQQAVETP
jgi:hypothetical protein